MGRNILEMMHLSCINLSRGAEIPAERAEISVGGGNSSPKDGISGPLEFLLPRAEIPP
jgi:hypothetical protein